MAYLFQPREAIEVYRAELRRNRKTPMTPSQAARTRKRVPKKSPGDRYNTDSYRRAIAYGCKRAGVPRWPPMPVTDMGLLQRARTSADGFSSGH